MATIHIILRATTPDSRADIDDLLQAVEEEIEGLVVEAGDDSSYGFEVLGIGTSAKAAAESKKLREENATRA